MNTSTSAEPKIFLSYSSADNATAKRVAEALTKRNLPVWFDEWHLARGADLYTQLQEAIRTSSAGVVLIGGGQEMGPWSQLETSALLAKAVHQKREMPIIPVLLPGAPDLAETMPILAARSTFDMRSGVTSQVIDRLAEEVERSIVLGAGVLLSATVGRVISQRPPAGESTQPLDLQAVVGFKYRLHGLANYVADEALLHAASAQEALPHDVLTTWVPAVVALVWNQGYTAALRTLLGFEGNEHTVANLAPEPVETPGSASGGLVSAVEGQDAQGPFVLISVADQPAARLRVSDRQTRKAVVDSLNGYGRLAAPRNPRATLLDRLGEIPIRSSSSPTSNLTQPIQRNLGVLAAIVARFGVPDHPWLRPAVVRPAPSPNPAAPITARPLAVRQHNRGGGDHTPPPEAF